jgi:hypothetical protein
MKKIKYIILTLGIAAGFGLTLVPVTANAASGDTVNVFSTCDNSSDGSSNTAVCQSKDNSDVKKYVGVIVNALLFILGAVAVIMIIIGGIRYATSMGDAKNIEAAKNTIMYSVIGLVVAVLAYAIVNYVINVIIK